MRIHHIGIACKNIKKAIKAYSSMYNVINVSEILHDELQNADLCILKTDTGLDVEFISGEKVANLIKSRVTYYHLCYSVENIEDAIIHFEENGCIVVSDPKPAILFGGKRVAFLMTPTGLIELVEE
ncbi:MAG: VOC family protein [Candidatus Cryptobacteroides sp.]|nr:VOC family protein [Candidatus Cryptobacteroides sp.]